MQEITKETSRLCWLTWYARMLAEDIVVTANNEALLTLILFEGQRSIWAVDFIFFQVKEIIKNYSGYIQENRRDY